MSEVEFVDVPLAHFAAETELVLAEVVGNDIGEHAGNVVAAFRRRNADLFKPADGDIGSTQNRLIVNQCVGAEIQTEGMSVEAVVGVVEGLVEIVHAKQKLVGHARSNDRIQSGSIVVYVDGRLLEVVLQVGTSSRQRRAGAQRCRLATLPTEPSKREVMLLGEVEIDLGHSVVTVAGGGIGTEEV